MAKQRIFYGQKKPAKNIYKQFPANTFETNQKSSHNQRYSTQFLNPKTENNNNSRPFEAAHKDSNTNHEFVTHSHTPNRITAARNRAPFTSKTVTKTKVKRGEDRTIIAFSRSRVFRVLFGTFEPGIRKRE